MTGNGKTNGTNKRILVADDEAVVQSVLKRSLGFPPYRLTSALDGAEAVALAEAEKPDLILLDINMPVKDGREVLRELRRNIHTRMIPVILLTGQGGVEDKVAGFELGADDYITKPFEIPELIARVEGILGRHRRYLSAHPMTRLPGAPSIEEEVNRRLAAQEPLAFLYADIDHFKAFNDFYGYAMGDLVIQETASMLLAVLTSVGYPEDFLGHIGGDDFVLLTRPSACEAVARESAARFDERAPSYYNAEHRARGYVPAKDRQGQERRFPFMSLSIAVVTNERRRLPHYGRVVDIAAEIKRYLKGRPDRRGSLFLKDRRSDRPEEGGVPLPPRRMDDANP